MQKFYSKAFTIDQINNGELDVWLNFFEEEYQKSGLARVEYIWEIERYVANNHFVIVTVRIYKPKEN